MNPSCAEPCFNGCFPSPTFLVPSESHDTASPSPRPSHATLSSNHEFVAATSSTLHPHAQFTNHESLPSLHESHANFTKAFPQFTKTCKIDEIRAQEYQHLNLCNNTCFDYTGFGIFSHAQQQQRPLCPSYFDVSYKPVNLHSQILYGGHESELELRMRERVMAFMNASESDYKLVFTANEVSAFKLITDSFQFQPNGELVAVYDHQSEGLDSMIEICKKQGVSATSAEFNFPNFGMDWRKLKKTIVKSRAKGLFVFPVRSRVTGAPYSYIWMSTAQENGWRVLLDACSLRPKETGSLGLSMFKPDFMVCSFYKVFAETPSGFACLFVKKSSVPALKDSGSATSIGIVSIVPAFKQFKLPDQETETETETETVDAYLERGASSSSEIFVHSSSGQFEVECRGLDHADSVGLMVINCRAKCLTNWLVNALMSLQHPYPENGLSLIRIYGPKVSSHRGPAVAFNIFDWKGERVHPALVQKLAGRNNISLGSALLQNVKFSGRNDEQQEQRALATGPSENNGLGLGLSKKRRGQENGIFVVTAALGFLTNFEDTYRLWAFVSRFLDADFVEKETWRYMALNQKTVDV